jgi:hypothetical protein
MSGSGSSLSEPGSETLILVQCPAPHPPTERFKRTATDIVSLPSLAGFWSFSQTVLIYFTPASIIFTSVPDPNPDTDLPDPHYFRPPGSGSISQRYGSGSRSFHHQEKIVRKTLSPTVL